MSTKLMRAQSDALAKVGFKSGAAFFMEQGLGKTLTVWHEFNECVKHFDATFMLVISPNSFKTGWRDEMEEHGFDYPVTVYESKKHKKCVADVMKHDTTVLVINFEAMRSEKVLLLIEELKEKHPICYIAADESIKLGNYKSQQTKSCITAAKGFIWRRILSGKPITQGSHNLWGQLRFIGALDGVNYFVFRNRFCVMGGYMMKQVVGVKNEPELRELLNEWTFLARKKDYLDLPPKSWTTRQVPLHPPLQKMFEEMEQEMYLELGDDSIATADLVLTRLLRQSQIASGFVIDEEGNTVELVEDKHNTRLMSVGDVYDEMDSKLIVVCVFKWTVDKIREFYKHLNPAFIVGGMTPQEVDENKHRFNNDPNCKIIVLTKAAKYGHTLIAQGECYTEMFLENSYSLDDRSQLEDRPHRVGTINPVTYIDVFSTPENKKNVQALAKKENVAAMLLGYKPEMFDA